MDQKAARAAIARVLKSSGAKARRGHLRIPAGDLFWYVDVRAAAPAPTAPLRLEVGCWLPAAGPEPDGGAVDCPLLADVPVGDDPVRSTADLVALVAPVASLSALRDLLDSSALPGALVDQNLRDLMP